MGFAPLNPFYLHFLEWLEGRKLPGAAALAVT
jgi:hypothetical protein